ncbi:hypothetical protein HYU16_02755 [Candidatus Woesearchaeota archaeon]|nr:hypothetical protein [Candidatus Woesearchaeota archaeon]
MDANLSRYFEAVAERRQIGAVIERLMLEKGYDRSQVASGLREQFGLSFGWALDYLVNVFSGCLYGTSSELSIKRYPGKGRQRLATLLSRLGVAQGHPVVIFITTLDKGFKYYSDGGADGNGALRHPEGDLESRVGAVAPAVAELKPYFFMDGHSAIGVNFDVGNMVSHGQFCTGVVVKSSRPNPYIYPTTYTITVRFKDQTRDLLVRP